VPPYIKNLSEGQAKHMQIAMARKVAAEINADAVITTMEAWTINQDDAKNYNSIMEQYGSLSKYPGRIEIVMLMIETPDGTWMGTSEIERSQQNNAKTFKDINLEYSPGIEGNFTGILSRPKGSTLH